MKNCKLCEQPIYDLTRRKFCSDKCMLENRIKLNKDYWNKRSLKPKTCKRCLKTVREPKMHCHCKSCRDIIAAPAPKKKCETCDNILQRVTLRFCTDCRTGKRKAATKRQTGERRAHALAVKHGLVPNPTGKQVGDRVDPKFTTRGRIRYEGYRTL